MDCFLHIIDYFTLRPQKCQIIDNNRRNSGSGRERLQKNVRVLYQKIVQRGHFGSAGGRILEKDRPQPNPPPAAKKNSSPL